MPAPKKNFVRRILELRLFLVVNLFLLFLLSLSFGREFLQDYQIQREINDLRAQADGLEVRNIEIAMYNTELQTQAHLEKEARLRLGLGDPGEQLVVIVEDEENVTGLANQNDQTAGADYLATLQESVEQISNPKRWFYYFFDQEKYITLKAYGE